MKVSRFVKSCGVATVATLLFTPAAFADSGFYIGGSIGDAAISFEDVNLGLEFDDSDTAWKGFGGYIFDMPVVDFGIEAGYVDFGAPSETIFDEEIGIEVTGLSAFGMVGVDFGLFGMFAKAGMVSWDVDFTLDGMDLGSDDGTDPAYGVGFRLTFSSVEVRAEYEIFDISDAEDVDMISAGVVWRF